VEMQTRLRLADVLINETENLDMAEDILSKGVLFPQRMPKLTIDTTNTEGLHLKEVVDINYRLPSFMI
jgi:hypothetical protein